MNWKFDEIPEHSNQVLIKEVFFGESLYSVAFHNGSEWTDFMGTKYEPICWAEIDDKDI